MNVNFIGRLGADAETVNTGNTQFISFSAAIDEGTSKEPSTRWVTVNADSNKYKNMVQYLKKGKPVYVSGTDRVSPYTSKSGNMGVDTRIWADRIEFISIGGKQNEENQASNSKEEKNGQMTTGTVRSTPPTPQVTTASPVVNDDVDDLPF